MTGSIFGLSAQLFLILFGFGILGIGGITQYFLHVRDVAELEGGGLNISGRIGFLFMVIGIIIIVLGVFSPSLQI